MFTLCAKSEFAPVSRQRDAVLIYKSGRNGGDEVLRRSERYSPWGMSREYRRVGVVVSRSIFVGGCK